MFCRTIQYFLLCFVAQLKVCFRKKKFYITVTRFLNLGCSGWPMFKSKISIKKTQRYKNTKITHTKTFAWTPWALLSKSETGPVSSWKLLSTIIIQLARHRSNATHEIEIKYPYRRMNKNRHNTTCSSVFLLNDYIRFCFVCEYF